MQPIEILVKTFVRRHRRNLKLTHRMTGWTAYRTTIRSWKGLEGLLPPCTIEKNIPNFGRFYKLVLAHLLNNHKCKLYQRAQRKMRNESRG